MTTKDLLKLSPEEKVEVWFTKFLGWGVCENQLPDGTPLYYTDLDECVQIEFPNIIDSLSAWNEYVEKPMGEMGLVKEIYFTLSGGSCFAWGRPATLKASNMTGLALDGHEAAKLIQNGQIFLASLDAAFHIPQVLEKISGG